jgi:diacylglycerol O-acyltransferase / wax synthase
VANRLRPLSGLDALFLYLEALGPPMHVASLIRLAPPRGRARAGFAATLRAHLLARLQPLAVLRRVLVEAPLAIGHPVWHEAADIDLGAHVQLRRLPAPGSHRQLDALVARLHARPLDRTRPLWRMVVIDGLADGSCALYLQSHHALVDGQSGLQLMAALLDTAPRPAARAGRRRPQSATVPPEGVALAALRATARQFASMLRGVPAGMRQVVGRGASLATLGQLRDSIRLAPRTPFNVQVEAARRYASGSLPLAGVQRVARHCHASVNDVVMAMVGGALREHLQRRGQLPAAPMLAAMPLSLRTRADEPGNAVSLAQCPLATDVADPLQQLQAIRSATRQIKDRLAAFRSLVPTDFPGLAAPLWATALGRLWSRGRLSERLPPLANLVVSNLPGPPIPLFVAGVEVRGFHPVSAITHGLGLNITLLSYNGSLEIGIVATPTTLAHPEQLLRALRRSLDRLLAGCSSVTQQE